MTYQAIMTKYLGATNSRGARIKAWCDDASVTIDYRHDLSLEGAHQEAMVTLVKKLGWHKYKWHRGGINNCYVFVLGEE